VSGKCGFNTFDTMDVDNNCCPKFHQFKMAVDWPSQIEQWTASFPLTKLIACAFISIINLFPAEKGSDPLSLLSRCTEDDVRSACTGAVEGIAKMVSL
jgi:hypothetical protein